MNKYRVEFDYASIAIDVYAWSWEEVKKMIPILFPHMSEYHIEIYEK